MRAAFGKVNTLHNHVLPWVDRPLVTQNLVGGEDGIDDAGLSLSRILPAPKGIFMEGTAQVYRGDTENLFAREKRQRPLDCGASSHLQRHHRQHQHRSRRIVVARTQSVWRWLESVVRVRRDGALEAAGALDLSLFYRADGIDLGAHGGGDGHLRPGDSRRPAVIVFECDSDTVRHVCVGGLPTRTAVVPRRTFRSVAAGLRAADESGDHRLCDPAERFSLLQDTGGSLVLSYWPSEFSQIRGQLRRTHYGEGLTANEFLFQFMFSMGAHGAHPF